MGVRYPTVSTTAIVNANIVTTAETIIATTPPLTLPLDFAQVLLFWYAVISLGASITSWGAKIRRGAALTSPLVNVAAGPAVIPTACSFFSGMYIDTPGAVAGQQYSLTATMTAATTNSTVNDVCLIAFAL